MSDKSEKSYGLLKKWTTAEISDKLVIKGSIKKPMPLNRLGMLLKKAGYRDVRRGEQRTRGWIV